MKIIAKYYDKRGRLRILKPITKLSKDDTPIRFKVTKKRREFPCCDYYGTCTNFSYVEVYPGEVDKSKEGTWNYLCRKHYYSEQKRLKGDLPVCFKVQY